MKYKDEERIKIRQLCLKAGLNSDKKLAEFFEVSIKTISRWFKNQQFKEYQLAAIRAKAGIIQDPIFYAYEIYEDRIYSPLPDNLS